MTRTTAALLALVLVAPSGARGQDYDPEARLAEMGITLPVPQGPSRSAFDRTVRTGNLDQRLKFRNYDRLADVSEAFNEMMEEIRTRCGEAGKHEK